VSSISETSLPHRPYAPWATCHWKTEPEMQFKILSKYTSGPGLHYLVQAIWHSEDRASWYILIIKPTRCTNFSNLFWNRTLHVSDRFSVHHQESSTVYTAIGICHTGYADCLLAGSGSNRWFYYKNSAGKLLKSRLRISSLYKIVKFKVLSCFSSTVSYKVINN
jgi:hypothetical protein